MIVTCASPRLLVRHHDPWFHVGEIESSIASIEIVVFGVASPVCERFVSTIPCAFRDAQNAVRGTRHWHDRAGLGGSRHLGGPTAASDDRGVGAAFGEHADPAAAIDGSSRDRACPLDLPYRYAGTDAQCLALSGPALPAIGRVAGRNAAFCGRLRLHAVPATIPVAAWRADERQAGDVRWSIDHRLPPGR